MHEEYVTGPDADMEAEAAFCEEQLISEFLAHTVDFLVALYLWWAVCARSSEAMHVRGHAVRTHGHGGESGANLASATELAEPLLDAEGGDGDDSSREKQDHSEFFFYMAIAILNGIFVASDEHRTCGYGGVEGCR